MDRLLRALPGLLVVCLVAALVFFTVMNDAFQRGATLYDSAEFATVIWRSGIALTMAPAVGGSMFVTHASTINYIPNLFSYVFPGDFLTYYGLVYALLYAGLVTAAYMLLLRLFPDGKGALVAMFGAFALFCGQAVFQGSWEMRSDYASPVCMLLGFRAFQLRKYKQALVWFILNVMVREDLAVIAAVPLTLLAAAEYWRLRKDNPFMGREKRNWAGIIIGATFVWMGVTILIQKNCFPVYNLFADQYFSPTQPFAHLTQQLLERRGMYLLTHAQGIWLPLVALLVTSIAWRDMKLFIGAVMFLPYIAINVLAKNELSGLMDSYKAFPLVVSVMWPSIVMLGNDDYARKRYAVLQCVVLACGLAYIRPGFIEHARQRWIPQPMVAHAQEYSDFGAQTLATLHPEAPTTRATQSILALYPYQFPVYLQSGVAYAKPKDYRKITTLIWFANDRDMGYIQKVLKTGKFTIINVPNTYIRFAVRK